MNESIESFFVKVGLLAQAAVFSFSSSSLYRTCWIEEKVYRLGFFLPRLK
jgi:hypothetical protein